MSKGLQAVKDIKEFIEQARTTHIITDGLKVIEKELKALEIIKKCPMFSLHDDLPKGTYRMYDCELYSHYDLTKEEYDLLKEVLL